VSDQASQLDRLKAAVADRYRIERELGRGGMATVYLAQDLKLDRQVAVKVLRPELAAAIGSERFLREIKLTARLEHPHILTLHDSGEADGFLYYVMPYVEGESLRGRLSREKQLPLDDALQIARECADALSYAHDHGVIHRDVKPENIMLESGHAVVTDFGIARAISDAGGDRLTETGIAVGTPAYMSPEQAAGSTEVDQRSDEYALACVVYEMLAGEPPFTGPTTEAVLRKQMTAALPDIQADRPGLPPPVVAALSRALAKTPADRFTTVAQFAEAITPPGGMTPDTRPVRTEVMQRRTLRIGVAAAAAVIAVIGTVLLFPRGSGAALDPARVLVVAFADASGREETTRLGHMVQDYIIQILTEAGFADVADPLTALTVSQNVAAAAVAAGPGDILALADEAGAGTVVSGSYYVEGDSLRIQTRISDARDGRLLGTVGPVVGSLGVPHELVARLGQEVVAALAPLLDQELGSFDPRARPAAYEAYEAYSDGLEDYLRDHHAAAARHFERAVAADPTFSRARLWAAQSYFVVSMDQHNLASHEKAESLLVPLVDSRGQLTRYERCRLDFVMAVGRADLAAGYDAARCLAQAAPGSDDARREVALFTLRLNRPREAIALLRELDPDRGLLKQWWGYWWYLCFAYHMLGDYEGELEVARQGRQRYPGRPRLLVAEARALAALGRLDDVAATLEAIRALPARDEPLGWSLVEVAVSLRTHGHRDAAHEVLDASIASLSQARSHDTEHLRGVLAWALYQAARWNDAQRLYEELAEGYPEHTRYLAALGQLAARRGDREEALRISEGLRSVEYPLREWRATRMRASIKAVLGDREEAMTLLQQVIDQIVPGTYWVGLHRDIDFESLRDYAPFQEFLRPKG
jgi:tRNA A-37 threonylcarbamoyl transferase component Bud32/tetratricopeptide (TPR) repeat protein/TolB-like protein